MKAGAYGLSLLSNPLNAIVLRELAERRLDLPELHRKVGLPPQTTLRVYLKALIKAGVLERHQEEAFPGSVSYELTSSGRDLLEAGRILETWLTASPERPLLWGEPAAKGAVKALVGGWSTNVLRALAARPLSLTELDRLIPSVNYPALERRLAAMRSAGLIRAEPGPLGSRPYKVTDWLRTAVAPLLTAATWEESRTPHGAEPLDRLDAEAIFLLLVPMLRLPDTQSGACRLAITVQAGRHTDAAGVVVEFDQGYVTNCRSDKRDCSARTRAIGSPSSWAAVLSGHAGGGLDTTGDSDLAGAVVDSLRRTHLHLKDTQAVA